MRKARLVVTCAQAPAYEVRISAGAVHDLGSYLERALDQQNAFAAEELAGGTDAACREELAGAAALCAVGEQQPLPPVLLLSDEAAPKQFALAARQSLAQAGFKVKSISVSPDSALEAAGELWCAMAQLSLPAGTVVVALGDASLLHLAGFVATAFGEGLACAFVPTTLEAAASMAVAHRAVLNVAGARGRVRAALHPLFSCIDLEVFQENAPEQWTAGFARMVQAAVMDSDDFFFWLSDSAASLRNRDDGTLCEALVRTLGFRSRVLSLEEQGDACAQSFRAYGEELACAASMPLACGMRFAALLSQFKGMISEEIVQAQDTLLTQLGCLPPRALDAAGLTEKLVRCFGAGAAGIHAGACAGTDAGISRERGAVDNAAPAMLHSEASQPSLRIADAAAKGNRGNSVAGCIAAAGQGAFLVLPTNIGSCQSVFVPAEELQSCLEVL